MKSFLDFLSITDFYKENSSSETKNCGILSEYIEKSGNSFFVRSEKGKNLGKFSSRKAAKRRLQQIEYFKHVKK